MEFSKFKACDCAGMNYHLVTLIFHGGLINSHVHELATPSDRPFHDFNIGMGQGTVMDPFPKDSRTCHSTTFTPMRAGGSETSRCWWLDPRSHEALRRSLGEALQDHWGAQPNSRQLWLKWDEIRSFCLGGLFFPEFGGCVHNYSIL